MEKTKPIINEDNDRVFDVVILEEGEVEILVKTGKGRGNQAFRKIKLENALNQITEAISI